MVLKSGRRRQRRVKQEVTTEEVRVIKNQKDQLTFVGFENEEKSQEPRNVSNL